jgi:hypothetical protein
MGGSEVPPLDQFIHQIQRDLLDLERTLERIEGRINELDAKLASVSPLGQKIDGLTGRVDTLHNDLRNLSSMTARSSSGQTLINLVSLIHEKVRTL